MVVEHKFITTLKPVDALRMASEFLGKRGFASQSSGGFALDGAGWTTIDMRRGKAVLRRASVIVDLPQQVRLEWDRGRVLVAASIGDRLSKKKRTALMLAIVNGLENLLVRGMPAQDAGMEWDQLEQKLARGRWIGRLTRWIAILAIIGLIVLIEVLATRR